MGFIRGEPVKIMTVLGSCCFPEQVLLLSHRLVNRIAYCREIVKKAFLMSIVQGTLPNHVLHLLNISITALNIKNRSSPAGPTPRKINLQNGIIFSFWQSGGVKSADRS
ncbi:MAG: hypothetical protein Q8S57_09895 [Methanoregula sp.]|nr:hypothetical protein [Methanoregula sp.]